MRRVNEAVKEVVSAHIAEDLSDPRIGFVTVTAVDTSPDLRQARVYVTVLGGEGERGDALAGLASARGFLQAQIGSELTMKRTPTLEFVYDHSTDRGMRLSRLIDETAPRDEVTPSDESALIDETPPAREAAAGGDLAPGGDPGGSDEGTSRGERGEKPRGEERR